MKINRKKFIYLISPTKINSSFYQDLTEVLQQKKVSFFQLRLKKKPLKKKLIIGRKIKKICKRFNPVVLDKTNKSVVIQVTALRAEIDKLALDLKTLGLISTSRTGAVAMTKGPKTFN